jgi:hypothetical protein
LYKFNIYDVNDLIVVIGDIDSENLIDYVIKSGIDLIISFSSNSGQILNSIRQFKQDVVEKRLSDINEFNSKYNYIRYRISFKEHAFTLALLDKFFLRPAPNNLKYTSEDKHILSTFLLKNINYTPLNHEKIAIICK